MTRFAPFLGPLLFLASLHGSAAAQPMRAVWLWEPDAYRLLDGKADLDEAIAFLDRAGVDTVYFYADAFAGRNAIRNEPEKLRRVVRGFHAGRKSVQALLGSAYLRTEEYVLPEKRTAARAMVGRVVDYQQESDPEERFDGISLDIEPHLLDDWSTRKEGIGLLFLEMLADLASLTDARLPLGAAIPFWFDGVGPIPWRGVSKPLSEHAQDVLDHVVLMDYRDQAEGRDGILRHAEKELAYARAIGRRVVIGVEVSPGTPAKITFHDETPEDLARELGTVLRALEGDPAFGGFAIHHYGTYRTWLE